MFAQSRFDIGDKLFSPDGDEDIVVGVRVTNFSGKIEESYLLKNSFVWCLLEELREVNNGK